MKIEFGPEWNKTTRLFEVNGDKHSVTIARPFSSKEITLTGKEAVQLAEALLTVTKDTEDPEDKEPVSSEPIVIKDWSKKFLFGLVSINWMIENRRPDKEADDFYGKYKNYLKVRILWRKYSWVFRTPYEYCHLPFKN